MSSLSTQQNTYDPNAKFKWIDKWSILRLPLLFILFAYCLNKKWDVTMMDTLIFHPERAHYTKQELEESESTLFEGWYYKISSSEMQLAVIPGVYHSDTTNDNYAFIMFITGEFYYEYRYSLQQYTTSNSAINTEQQFYLHIGANNFSRTALSLYLEASHIHSIQPRAYPNTTETITLHLTFDDQDNGFPVSLFDLGAMSYVGWFPFLDCYHAILSMNFLVHGTVKVGDNIIYQSNKHQIANGYLEKDWGSHFPESWIWIQANHFDKDENVSLIVILSKVPVFGQSIAGFITGIYLNKQLYILSSTSLAKVNKLEIEDDDKYRNIVIEINNVWRTQKLSVIATVPNVYHMKQEEAMDLYPHILSPDSNGYMIPTIKHILNATVRIRFEDVSKGIVFESVSHPSDVECHAQDNMEWLLQHFN